MAAGDPPHVSPDDIVALTPLLRHVLRARIADEQQVSDLVQECLTRLLQRRTSLSDDTLAGYAVVVARNTASARARHQNRDRRHLPGLVDLSRPPDPLDEVIRADDIAALRAAIRQLPPGDRHALIAHDIEHIDTATLARQGGSTPGGVASRLNRARGRLRVEYVLAVQRTTLPSPQCHPILVALSTADRRRQDVLEASDHLATCDTCASLGPALIERRRGVLALIPIAVVMAGARRVGRWGRNHPTHATATAAVGAGLAVAAALGVTALERPPAPAAQAGRPAAAIALSAGSAPMAATPDSRGYWLTSPSGRVVAYGDAHPYGSAHPPSGASIRSITAFPGGAGYWLAATNGQVFAFGQAALHGSEADHRLHRPIVGITATSDGRGYWLVASDGGVFAFGDARYYGSKSSGPLSGSIVGMARTTDNHGYWLLAANGGVFAFGDAHIYATDQRGRLSGAFEGIAPTADSGGYWLTTSNGHISSFGNATPFGTLTTPHLNEPVIGITATHDAKGYWLIAADGGVFAFGDAHFYGSPPGGTPTG